MTRLRCLRLDTYGIFDGVNLSLGKGLTIVVGANEVGKSTALNALADLLWGVPLRHPLADLTPRATIRVSAELEDAATPGNLQDGAPLVVVRTARGLHTGQAHAAVANPWGVDGEDRRRHWLTAFGLGHSLLRDGGRQVCEGGGDLAELVFTAQHGRGVQELLREIEQRADALYKDHRNNRSVSLRVAVEEYQHRREAADQALVRASHVVQAERDVHDLELRTAEAAEHEAQARRHVARLAEHTRCLDVVHTLHRTRNDIAALRAEGACLEGEDLAAHNQARATLQDVDREHARTAHQIHAWTAEREALTVDAGVLADADLIDDLHAQTQARLADRERADDLRHRAGTRAGQARDHLVALLGHPDPRDTETVLAALTLPADLTAQFDALAEQHPHLLAERARHVDRVDEVRAELVLLDAGAHLPDVEALAPLADVVRTLTGDSGAPARLRAARSDQIEADRRRRQALLAAGALDPDAAPPTPPGQDDLASAARRVEAAGSAVDRAVERRQEAEAALEQRRRRLRELENARTVQPGTLTDARQRRDDLWARVTLAWLNPTAASGTTVASGVDPQDLATAFAEQVRTVDELADQLILQAQVDAELTHAQHDADDAERELRQRSLTLAEATADRDGELSAWHARWAALGVAVPATAHAETVRQALLTAAGAVVDETTARRTALAVEPEITEWAGRLRSLLNAHACAPTPTADVVHDSLAVLDGLLAAARSLIDDVDRAREQQERRRTAQKSLDRSQERLTRSDQALAGWDARWSALRNAAGLPETLDPTGWTERRTRLESARTAHGEATSLEHQADTSLRAWETFRAAATGLGERHRLSGAPEHLLEQLTQRLGTSRADQRTHQERTAAIDDATSSLAELGSARATARARLDALCQRHALPDFETLAAAADRGEHLAVHRQAEAAQLEKLRTAIDPEHHPDDVLNELTGTDRADLQTWTHQADEELASAQQLRENLSQQLGAAKKTLTELRQRGDSADLNARAHEALATVGELAEEYAGLHLQRVILREALEADAAKHASPLLQSAGRVLERLTGGRWVALQAEDNGDRTRRVLVIRHDGQCQPLASLSEGTADQVFLALRLAGITHRQNERLKTGQVLLPVVLDDVLMAFDDERAVNALRTLADLASGIETEGQQMQVVLFTHHQHLAELAEQSDGLDRGDLRVVALRGRPLPEKRIDPDQLRQSMAWSGAALTAASRVPSRGPGNPVGLGLDVDPAQVRAWARENGVEVADRGRLPADVVDRYRAAQQS
jgi:hypothetical protein